MLLENSQERGLRGGGEVPYLVEEQRPPPPAERTNPDLRARAAPEKAPFTCPKRRLSTSAAGSAPQLTAMNGPVRPDCGVDVTRQDLLPGARWTEEKDGDGALASDARERAVALLELGQERAEPERRRRARPFLVADDRPVRRGGAAHHEVDAPGFEHVSVAEDTRGDPLAVHERPVPGPGVFGDPFPPHAADRGVRRGNPLAGYAEVERASVSAARAEARRAAPDGDPFHADEREPRAARERALRFQGNEENRGGRHGAAGEVRDFVQRLIDGAHWRESTALVPTPIPAPWSDSGIAHRPRGARAGGGQAPFSGAQEFGRARICPLRFGATMAHPHP